MKALRRIQTSSFPWSPSSSSPSPRSPWLQLRLLHAVVSSSSSSAFHDRGILKSPLARRRRKQPLHRQQWRSFFTEDGKLRDGGMKLLKKVRNRGIEPSIRAEVWPFLLGFYDLNSTAAERKDVRRHKREEYQKLRRQCQQIIQLGNLGDKELKDIFGDICSDSTRFIQRRSSANSERSISSLVSIYMDQKSLTDNAFEEKVHMGTPIFVEDDNSESTSVYTSASKRFYGSSDSESSLEQEQERVSRTFPEEEHGGGSPRLSNAYSTKNKVAQFNRTSKDFFTWQRIIHLDAVRANNDWIGYSPAQSSVSYDNAQKRAISAGLSDYEYDYLEPCSIYHAARLVSILEAYVLYDPEIGYCQGMTDLLSPILAVMDEDYKAFWCFVGFMKKARHNFRLDEVGIRRQLSIVAKIIRSKDSLLYRHLEKLQAEDCSFVYRMVVVMFRRELTFEQTLSLWEVIWANQAAVRAGVGKSAWARIRMHVPPTDDLLLYAIASSVLQRRKLIVEKYSSMDEILRECNDMAGKLDVWKLLNDAHDLVISLHDKIR